MKMLSCDTTGVTQEQCEGVCAGFSEAGKQCIDQNNCVEHADLCSEACGL